MLSRTPETEPSADERIAALEAALAASTAERDKLADERAKLRAAYERVLEELTLLRRRLFAAKAERVDTKQIEFEFEQKKAELDQLAGAVPDAADHGEDEADESEDEGSDGDGPKRRKKSKKSSWPSPRHRHRRHRRRRRKRW